MRKKFIKIGVATVLAVAMFTSLAFSQGYVRSINVLLNNIKVKVDNKEISLDEDIFVFDDTLYFPASILERGLNFDYSYNQREATVSIDTAGLLAYNPGTSFTPFIQLKNNEIRILKSKLKDAERELDKLKLELDELNKNKYPYRSINTVREMEAYLKEHFKTLDNIPMTIRFTSLGWNRYRLTAIAGNSPIQLSDLDRRNMEGWVEDMFYIIRELYDAGAAIEGYIRTSDYATNHVSFNINSSSLHFNFARPQ